MSFGGKNWTISPADFQLTKLVGNQCLGAFFEISTGTSAPSWIVGDTFLVCPIFPSLLNHQANRKSIRKMFTLFSAMTRFLSDLLNSPVQLWPRTVQMGKRLQPLSVLWRQPFLQLLLVAVRQSFNRPQAALWAIMPRLKSSFPWRHFGLQVLPLDTHFSLNI